MIDEGQQRMSEVAPAGVGPRQNSYKGQKDLIEEGMVYDRRNSEDTLYLLRQSSVGERFSDLGSAEGVRDFGGEKGKAGAKYPVGREKESKGDVGQTGRLMEESYAREMALEYELRALRDQRSSYGAKAKRDSEARLKGTKFDAEKKMASMSMQEGVRLPVPNSTEYESIIEVPANFSKDPKQSSKKKSKKDLEY